MSYFICSDGSNAESNLDSSCLALITCEFQFSDKTDKT